MIIESDVIVWTLVWILVGIAIGVYFGSKYKLVQDTCKECGQSLPLEIHRREVEHGQATNRRLARKSKN